VSALPGQLVWFKTFYRQNWLAQEVRNGPQYHDVFAEGETASSLTDSEKIILLEGIGGRVGEQRSLQIHLPFKVWKIHSTLTQLK